MRSTCLIVLLSIVMPRFGNADTLRGVVRDAAGKPLAGVRVDIATALPKLGEPIFCPSCYLDCRKFSRTDANGKFEIAALDPKLKFRLLATAPDKQSAATEHLDPEKQTATITLKDFPAMTPAERILRGTIISDDGVPLPGALVEPIRIRNKAMKWIDVDKSADPAVSDENGEFRLFLKDDVSHIDIEVTAEGCAGAIVHSLIPGDTKHKIRVPAGATVRGRLAYEGKPQAFTTLAVVQLNRGGDGVFLNAVPTTTDADGAFRISALPANEPYAIFTPVIATPVAPVAGTPVIQPVIQTSLFSVKANGSTCDLGAIELVLPLALRGKVHGRDGTMPRDLTLSFRRMPAWDSIEVKVQADGQFSVENLPPETYEVFVTGDHWALDETADLKYQRLSLKSCGIRLEASLADVALPLRPLEKNETGRRAAIKRLPREAKGEQVLAGKVVDPDGKPVAGVRVNVVQRGTFYALSKSATSRADGSFRFTDLPNDPLDLMYYDTKARGYPAGSAGITILHPGIASPSFNQSDIKLLFDSRLTKRPAELELKPK